ncbi:MAG: hypothetical protein ACFFAV_04275 [Candidatus Hermodarchaeota archaeon]
MYLLKLNNKHEIITTVIKITTATGFERGCGPKNGIRIKAVTTIIPINMNEKQYSRMVLVIFNHLIMILN